jgi:hypothetical protein
MTGTRHAARASGLGPAITRYALLGAAGLLLLGSPGCGYRWGASLDSQPPRTVSLDTVENRTIPHRPDLEYALTRRLKDEIATDRRLILRDGAADVRLKVSLTYFTEPTLVENLDTGERAEIQLLAKAQVQAIGDALSGKRVNRPVTVSINYTPGIGDSREAGFDRLWRELSREILDVAADTEWAPEK